MEVTTPTTRSALKIDEFGYGGNGKVMIWGLLANDTDSEMLQMTDLLQKIISVKGLFGGRLDSSANIKGIGPKLGQGRSLYITGHSRFLKGDGTYIPISERELGGFPIDAVIAELVAAVVTNDITYIELWCCETACKAGSIHWTGNAGKAVAMQCDGLTLSRIREKLDKKEWSQLSSLDYICLQLARALMKELPRRFSLHVSGLNGVGYITPDDLNIVTFDQASMLDTVNKISELEKQVKSKKPGQHDEKNLRLAEKRFSDHLKARQCHYVVYFFDTGNLKFEIQQANGKAAELKKIGKIISGEK